MPRVRGLLRAVIRYQHCSTPRHLGCDFWGCPVQQQVLMSSFQLCDSVIWVLRGIPTVCTVISRASSKASQVIDQGVLLPMQAVPDSWERCWTMGRHWGCRAGGSDTSLPQGSWHSCCSAMVLFQIPCGCPPPTQQNLWCMHKGGSQQSPGCEQDGAFHSCKALTTAGKEQTPKHAGKGGQSTQASVFECPP